MTSSYFELICIETSPISWSSDLWRTYF